MNFFSQKDIKDYLLFSSSNILNFLKLSSRVLVLPSVTIYPTSTCNFKCVMCVHNAEINQVHKTMDFVLLKNLINECAGYFIKPRIHFSGYGEPLVYPRITKIFNLCHKKKLPWSMTTNGYFLEKYAKEIVENNCKAINVSIHGNEQEHEKITGISNSFKKTISGLKKIDYYKTEMKKSNPLIAINSVITNDNALCLKDTLSIFVKQPVNSITFQHLLFTKKDQKQQVPFLIQDKNKLERIQEFVKLVGSTQFPKKVNTFPKINHFDINDYYLGDNKKFKNGCLLPWLTTRIFPDGQVGLCDNNFWGDLNKETLKMILNKEKVRNFRNQIKHNKYTNPLCFRCCHRQYY